MRAGDVIAGRYRVDRVLGTGGMGVVVAATHIELDMAVAVKLLLPHLASDARSAAQIAARMLREARATAALASEHVVRVLDVGRAADGLPFIVMELLEGQDLEALARARGPLPVEEATRYVLEACDAVAEAHAHGIVHRDLKPSNLFLASRRGQTPIVKVLDFGISKVTALDEGGQDGGALTATNAALGSPYYMSPEQLRDARGVDGRTDVWSLGMVLHRLLAGRLAFESTSVGAHIARIVVEDPVPLRTHCPGAPEALEIVIRRCIERDPDRRMPTVGALASALAPFAPPGSEALLARIRSFFDDPESESAPQDPGDRARPAPPSPDRGASGASGADSSGMHPFPAVRETTGASPHRGLRRAVPFAVLLAVSVLAAGLVSALRGANPTGGAGSASGAAAVPRIAALRCAAATVQGDDDEAPLARAIGVAACARLALAIGARWAVPTAPHELRVEADLDEPGAARVKLAVAGREARGDGATPIAAVQAAVAALAAQVDGPPLSPRDIERWGATDEAGARRIERVFRLRNWRLSPSFALDTLKLVETDPSSPFSHLLLLMGGAGSPEMRAKSEQALPGLIDRLPPARATMLRGVLQMVPNERDRDEAFRRMQQAYAEAPDDAEMTSLYVTLGLAAGAPEAYAMLDRLAASSPPDAIACLDNAVWRSPDRDPVVAARHASLLIAVLPEAWASSSVILSLLWNRRLDEARAAIQFGERLGLGASSGDPLNFALPSIDVELAAGNPARARELAQALLSDPRPFAQMQGGAAVASALLLEGRLFDARRMLLAEARRQRTQGNFAGAALHAVRVLTMARLLGDGPPPVAALEHVQEALDHPERLAPADRARFAVELALAHGRRDGLERALTGVDAEARAVEVDPLRHDDVLVQTVPLVRALRGDAAAAALWKRSQHARVAARLRVALDAALALERLGDRAGAEQVYRLAEEAGIDRDAGFERMAASVRLARLAGGARRPNEAGALAARLWEGADAGLRAGVERMK